MWQKCPICEGKGYLLSEGFGTHYECGTCNGKKIINIDTGKPPEKPEWTAQEMIDREG